MKKQLLIDPRAEKELISLSRNVQLIYISYFDQLKKQGRLEPPEGKKITKDLFEIRFKLGSAYRGIYAYVLKNKIVILTVFQKKTQKTPRQAIKLAEKRKHEYFERNGRKR